MSNGTYGTLLQLETTAGINAIFQKTPIKQGEIHPWHISLIKNLLAKSLGGRYNFIVKRRSL